MTENSNKMRLTGRDGSCDFVKKTSSLSSKTKKNNTKCQRENEVCRLRSTRRRNESIRLRIGEMGPICISRKKAAAVFPESKAEEEEEEEDGDFERQFGKETQSNEDECSWLSSNCTSPSSSFNKFTSSCDLFLDELLVSWLSLLRDPCVLLSKEIIFFDGSRINPIEEASLVLDRTIPDTERNLQEDMKEEEVVTWLLSSTENDAIDSSVTFSESAESSYEQSCFEDSTGSENFLTPLSTHLDSPSQVWDLDRTGFWVSLVNLDGEDSKWISDTEFRDLELDYFESDFPSPSYKSSWGSEVQSSNSSVTSLTEVKHEKSQYILSSECVSEAADFEDFNTNEPLFWPFEPESEWSSELTWDCFCMSPRKDRENKVGTPRPHDRKMDPKEGCKRRLVFSSVSTASKILEWKCRSCNNDVTTINSMPSRLRKSAKFSMKILPIEMKDDIVKPIDGKVPIEQSVGMCKSIVDEDFASNEELPIETLLGLDEFDGHEGIGWEFNKDDFSLDKSLRESEHCAVLIEARD